MNFTLHLTESCNMDCIYCVHEKQKRRMSEEILYAACELAFSKGKTAGLCFFGGEPLLEKELICKALDYCRSLSQKTGIPFQCKMTTNGTLLDEAFLRRAKLADMTIGMSFDGLAQTISRPYADGSSSLPDAKRAAKLLLRELPHSYAMLTLAPQAVGKFADSVEYLYDLGFRRITATPAYGKRALWTEEQLEMLEDELIAVSAFYAECFRKGEHFYFSPFDAKIRQCITGQNPADRCHLGQRQMPVNVDGKIYACTQFIGDEDFCMGDVFHGLDMQKQTAIASRVHVLPEECRECDLRERCTNSCGCLNRLETGDEAEVSPMQCAYERTLIRIADTMADHLYEEDPEKFRKWFVK